MGAESHISNASLEGLPRSAPALINAFSIQRIYQAESHISKASLEGPSEIGPSVLDLLLFLLNFIKSTKKHICGPPARRPALRSLPGPCLHLLLFLLNLKTARKKTPLRMPGPCPHLLLFLLNPKTARQKTLLGTGPPHIGRRAPAASVLTFGPWRVAAILVSAK